MAGKPADLAYLAHALLVYTPEIAPEIMSRLAPVAALAIRTGLANYVPP